MSIASHTNTFCTKDSSKLVPPMTYPDPQQTSKMECFATKVKGLKPLCITARSPILNICGSSRHQLRI